ncbi:hypothetical protein Tco_1453671 [Tanacetum coccineum]
MDEIVESENVDVITINSFRPPVIEDWNSDDDSEEEFIPNDQDKTVKPSTEKIKFVKSGKINTACASVNTADRSVNTADLKTTVNHSRPISNSYKKGYSQATRPFNKYSANKNNIFNKKVNSVKVKDTNARDRAVVSENKRKWTNAVKASACWVWKAKNSSASTKDPNSLILCAQGRSKSIMA